MPQLRIKQNFRSSFAWGVLLFSLVRGVISQETAPANAYRPEKLTSATLPNLVQLRPRVFSGGLPEGDAAFAELQKRGVKTIISVDGAKPDVATARKFGLRYVHLPHGYDGIETERGEQLAKAVQSLPGPIYIHCHHGKHRSPAAAAVACIGAGMLTAEEGTQVLATAGTSPQYRGLFAAVARTQPIPREKLSKLEVEFREVEKIPPFAEAMVHLEHTFSHLKLCVDAGWKTPANQPALTPAHEALLLREHYTEMLRTEDVAHRPAAFRKLLQESETNARDLERLLNDKTTKREQLAAAFQKITADCTTCHRDFRDQPRSVARPSAQP